MLTTRLLMLEITGASAITQYAIYCRDYGVPKSKHAPVVIGEAIPAVTVVTGPDTELNVNDPTSTGRLAIGHES